MRIHSRVPGGLEDGICSWQQPDNVGMAGFFDDRRIAMAVKVGSSCESADERGREQGYPGATVSWTLEQLLRSNGFVLLRQHKHLVWRHPSGRNFITAKTPS